MTVDATSPPPHPQHPQYRQHRLRIETLGTVKIWLDGEPLSDFKTRKNIALLIYLISQPGTTFTRAHLRGLLWGQSSEKRAAASLRQALSNLGRVLPKGCLHLSGMEVGWNSEMSHWLDLNHVAGQPDLYGGEFLRGFVIRNAPMWEEWLAAERERLRILALNGLLDAGEAAQERDAAEAIALFQRALILEPWRESIHRRIMWLHWRQGERAAALAQYEACVQILADELDVPPSPETEEMALRIADGAPALPNNLPEVDSLPPILGRDTELNRVSDLVEDNRLVTLTGLGGIGKTRLALEVGQSLLSRFPDGVFFVDLVDESPDRLPQAIGEALNLEGDAEQLGLTEHLHTQISHKSMLILLDNFEPFLVNPAPRRFVQELLQRTSRLHFLVTSRERLQLRAEQAFPLRGLPTTLAEPSADDLPPAVALFAVHARRADPGFALDSENRRDAERICAMVEGMPLAIELAAAWTRILPCAEIVAEIEADLGVLHSPHQDVPPRHASLEAVLDATWRRLSRRQQQTLQVLTVFRGSFDRDAAASVTGVSLADLAELMDRSLLARHGRRRFRFHERLRQFIEAQGPPPVHEVHYAHARHFGQRISTLSHRLRSTPDQETLAHMRQDIENIRVGWRWLFEHGTEEDLWPYVDGLSRFLHIQGWFQEAYEFLTQVSARLRTAPTDSAKAVLNLSDTLCWLADCSRILGKRDEAGVLLEESTQLLRQIDAPTQTARNLQSLAIHMVSSGRYAEALATSQESLLLRRSSEDRWELISGLISHGEIYQSLGDYAKARAAAAEARSLSVTYGYELGQAGSSSVLGDIAHEEGKRTEARRHHEETLAICHRLDYQRGVALSLQRLASLAYEEGNLELTQRHALEAQALYERIGTQSGMVRVQLTLIQAALTAGDLGEAHHRLFTSLAHPLQNSTVNDVLLLLMGMVDYWLAIGETDQADQLLVQLLRQPGATAFTRRRLEKRVAQHFGKLPPSPPDTDGPSLAQLCTRIYHALGDG